MTNALVAIMDLTDRVFKDQLVRHAVVFIDDILVYSQCDKEHENYLREVLQILRHEKIYAELNKCKFWLQIVSFLGHVIFEDVSLWIPRI